MVVHRLTGSDGETKCILIEQTCITVVICCPVCNCHVHQSFCSRWHYDNSELVFAEEAA